jgi:hypothetical protein
MRLQWAILAVALAAGCGGDDAGVDDRQAVLAVMEDARAAVVDGDGETACALLTEHGRRRALGYQVDFAPEGTPVPTDRRGVPQTCVAILRAKRRLDPSSIDDLERAAFRIESIDGDRAGVRLQAPEGGPDYAFTLVKTARGWRIDDSDAVPSGY